MKVLINTYGTRGDIQPYIALGKGLSAAGHDVTLGTSDGYQALVEEHCLRYAYIDSDMLAFTQAVLGETTSARETFRAAQKMLPAMAQMMEREWQVAREVQPDLIVYHSKCLGSLHAAQKLQIPAVLSLPLPFFTPTSAFPVPFLANLRLGKWFNRFSYRLMRLPVMMYNGMVNRFRVKTLGMPPARSFANGLTRDDGSPVPVIYPYSSHLLPTPPEFPSHVHVTGYWFLDRSPGWQAEPALLRFLEDGPPPVYVGFGSMGGGGAAKRAAVVVEALQAAGQRGVLNRGWGGLNPQSLPANIHLTGSVPHDWLFPQMTAVVHHGGAGTTAAGLRAGKPSVICPFLGDQPFWGWAVSQAGAGPRPIPQSSLSVERLTAAIHAAVHDTGIRRSAEDIGAKICAEDGVARAVEVLEALARRPAADAA